MFSLQLQCWKPRKQRHLHLEPGPLLHIVTEGRRGVILLAPPHHSVWLKLMAPSTHSDTDVLLGAGYCLAQRNHCSPIHKSNPGLVGRRFVMLLHNRVSWFDGDTMRGKWPQLVFCYYFVCVGLCVTAVCVHMFASAWIESAAAAAVCLCLCVSPSKEML